MLAITCQRQGERELRAEDFSYELVDLLNFLSGSTDDYQNYTQHGTV